MRYLVSGIGTDVGKTLVSAVLVQAFGDAYWKPIQAGDLYNTDTHKVQRWVSKTSVQYFPEKYALHTPASPHYAAEIDKVHISLEDFVCPQVNGNLIIEGAGGLLVPINDKNYVADFALHFQAKVILVIKHYLGSINHSLLSLAYLQSQNIALQAVVFNGEENEASESAILRFLNQNTPIVRVPHLAEISPESIAQIARKLPKEMLL
ncbi:MAG: dethiobiotin synthase [Chitinophagales bacterium]|nr:dethiobiotin synthase [Bacteroidota bacterium]MCB9042628.1 dethiobiotin synthase [Chitinophagales bacterium]